MGDTVSVECRDCLATFRYKLTNDGRILHGCPECESDRVRQAE
ncbi:Zn finger [Halorubrum tailed virus 27]|uniref:Zn finger n=1 Tax=Halorubrum tailed virus 27 TaxID=2878008 RepID=A0AAE8XYN7_9CAUD|nr:Zn finger [Halorubrum tailed virus 27]UBF22760.1 Zn finger [Halorubrum tailed virus 27]